MLSDDLVYLRKLELTDLERTWVWINDPEVYLKIGSQVPISRTAQQKWFERLDQSSDKIVLAICLKEGDVHVGNVSLDSIEPRHRTARLSIFLGESQQRGHSVGTRAIKLLSDYAFNFLNLNRIWCKATAGDDRVSQFYEKLGFKIEGTMRQHEFIDGRYVDKVILGLLNSDTGCGT
ncbi:Spermidine N(1)-acetyltransferase [Thiorhodovibrio winogradskyi]|uniref:Spermidine N(1)-acetyltransferase n=1 Tax=Thiorhodovibrio winogradskyi TaxID=77007 RepID=A0ABZ0SBL5_9GAMM|nr:GNAT family protein [Thiorhodovibrio winogradskyi]